MAAGRKSQLVFDNKVFGYFESLVDFFWHIEKIPVS